MREQGSGALSPFEREVEGRFGVLPAFFRSAPEAPEVVQQLWLFARAAYLDSPLPPLFKERLFVYLSRFCEVRYCVVRHCGFLLGKGRPSGDPNAELMTIQQALDLLRRPFPSDHELEAVFSRFEALASPLPSWPEPDTEDEAAIFACSSVIFLEPARSDRARADLRAALGTRSFEQLAGFLAFVRTAHFWTLMHPEIGFEEDVAALLRDHEELARHLLGEPEAGRCEMGQRLFDELVSLRREKDEMDALKRAEEQRSMLIAELNHRVKNTLATVQSIAAQTLRSTEADARSRDTFEARLIALSKAHDLLTQHNWAGASLRDLLHQELLPHCGEELARCDVECPDLRLRPKVAVPLSMALHELATNALKHGALSGPAGKVCVACDILDSPEGKRLRLVWRETGGPQVEGPRRKGFGSRLIERGLAHELNGDVRIEYDPEGIVCIIDIPLAVKGTDGDGL